MNKINHSYDADFVAKYLAFTLKDIQPRVQQMLDKVPGNLKAGMASFFDRAGLEALITGKPEALEKAVIELFNQFPVIAERYCYSYLLQRITLPAEALKLELSCPVQKLAFDRAISETVASLRTLTSAHALSLTPKYVGLLQSGISSTEKKRYLSRLVNARRGGSQVTDADKKLFDPWVNALASCFDYAVVSAEFGHALVDQLDIAVCPYCALENIQAFAEIDVRPELDHFYPKSRFPFLATSLYNLIPAGWICNQRHKRNNPMLGRLNPYLAGFDQGPVFTFGFLPDSDIRKTLNVRLIPLNCDLKKQHAGLFKIEALYGGAADLRAWFAGMYKAQQWLKQSQLLAGFDAHHPLLESLIDLEAPASKVSARAFKIDAINDVFELQLDRVALPEE